VLSSSVTYVLSPYTKGGPHVLPDLKRSLVGGSPFAGLRRASGRGATKLWPFGADGLSC